MEWANLKKADDQNAKLELVIKEEHYPFWSKGRVKNVIEVKWFAKDDKGNFEPIQITTEDNDLKPIGKITASKISNHTLLKDLWLLLTWSEE